MKNKQETLIIISLVIVLALASVFAFGFNGAGKAQSGDVDDLTAKFNIRISACNSLQHPQTQGLQVMKEYIEKESEGKITVSIHPNSQLGDEIESLEMVQKGTLEMATASMGPCSVFVQDFKVFDMPFLFDNYEQAWATLDSPVGTELMNTFETVGLKGMAYMENGFRHVTNNVRPIETVDDYKGIKIRTMEVPTHMKLFQMLGANPTPIPFSELYLSLQQNVVAGQENPLANIFELRLNEVQDYVSLTGHIYDAMPLVANLDWYNSMPLKYQEIVTEGAILGQNYSRFVNQQKESLIIKSYEGTSFKVNEVSLENKEKMREATQPQVREIIEGEIGNEPIELLLSGIERVKKDISAGLDE